MAPSGIAMRGLAFGLGLAAGLFVPSSGSANEAAQARKIDAFVGICILEQPPEAYGLEQCGRGHGVASEVGVLCRAKNNAGNGTHENALAVSIWAHGSGNDPILERMCEVELGSADADRVTLTLKERLEAIEPELAGSITNEPPAVRMRNFANENGRSHTSAVQRQIRLWRDGNEFFATLHSSAPNSYFKPGHSRPAGQK